MKLLFLGVGNRDRGDDAVGPLLAEQLADDKNLKKLDVESFPHSGEGASLMDAWRDADLAVVVDAMKSGAEVGTIRRFDAAQEKLNVGEFYYSSHLFSLAEAVEMARLLKRLPKALIIYGIEGQEYSFGKPLSQEVDVAMREVKRMVLEDFSNA